jgi:hypothetical protein
MISVSLLMDTFPHYWNLDRFGYLHCDCRSPLIMSGIGARENVFATRMALTNTKLRLKGAQTGHSLLAKKRDALTTRFRAILRKVDEAWALFCPVESS